MESFGSYISPFCFWYPLTVRNDKLSKDLLRVLNNNTFHRPSNRSKYKYMTCHHLSVRYTFTTAKVPLFGD